MLVSIITRKSAEELPQGKLFVRWAWEYFANSNARVFVQPVRAEFSKGDLRRAVRQLQDMESLPVFTSQAEIISFVGNLGKMRGWRWRYARQFTTIDPIKVRPATDLPSAPRFAARQG